MTSIQTHKDHIREHLQEIQDAIAIGIEKRPSTIGLHVSACSISLLELYLHVLGKITVGTILKHEWFKAPKPEQKVLPFAERKLGVDFPDKDKILSLMYVIEEKRNTLIYGKPSNIALTEVYSTFEKLHSIIKENLKEHGEEIE